MMNPMKALNFDLRLHILSFFGIMAYLIPYFTNPKGYYPIIDNLDGIHPSTLQLIRSGLSFASYDALVPGFMNGVTRAAFSSPFNPYFFLHLVLAPHWALVGMVAINCMVGYLSMYLLITHLTPHPKDGKILLIASGVSLTFCMLQFWLPGSLSVSGMPFAIWAFLKLSEKTKYRYAFLVILLLYGLFSQLVLVGVFVIAILTIWYARSYALSPKPNHFQAIGILVLCLAYSLSEKNLILYALAPSFIDHRTEILVDRSFASVASLASNIFVSGQLHSLSEPLLLWMAIPILIGVTPSAYRDKNVRLVIATVVLLVALSLLFRSKLLEYASLWMPGLQRFQFDRFYMLLPCFLYALFGIAAIHLVQRFKIGIYIVAGVLFIQLAFIIGRNPVHRTFAQPGFKAGYPTYEQFFAANIFERIKQDLAKQSPEGTLPTVGCVGFYPSVANYNGLATVDGYCNLYPLAYKHSFREVIAPELQKNKAIKDYFDTWGNRCYLFSSEIGNNLLSTGGGNHGRIESFSIDFKSLHQLGAEYIISSIEIQLSADTHLELLGKYTDANSYWDFFVYRIVVPPTLPKAGTVS